VRPCTSRRRRKTLVGGGGGVNGIADARAEIDESCTTVHLARRLLFADRGGAAAKQRRWRCATKTRRTAERTAAAGKLTDAGWGLLPPPPSKYDGTRALMSVYVCVCADGASEPARIDRDAVVVFGNYRRNTCPRRGSRPKRYRGIRTYSTIISSIITYRFKQYIVMNYDNIKIRARCTTYVVSLYYILIYQVTWYTLYDNIPSVL